MVASVVVDRPRVTKPKLALVEKRLVDEAVVAKKLVVVAEVPVALTKVKFWRVEEALARMLENVPRPVEVRLPPLATWKKRLVVEAVPET